MNIKDLLNNYANQNVSSNDVKSTERNSKNLGRLSFDAIPDFLIPFGYTDDITVVSLVIK